MKNLRKLFTAKQNLTDQTVDNAVRVLFIIVQRLPCSGITVKIILCSFVQTPFFINSV